jgi:uncharacterized membrane protein YqaE (UPF0057 family)
MESIIIRCSVQNMQENNAYKVVMSVFRPPISLFVHPPMLSVRTYVSGQEFWLNLVWTLCHWAPQKTRSFYFPTIGNSSVVESRNCQVVATLASLQKYGKQYNYVPVLAMTTVVAIDEVIMKVIILINFSRFKKLSALQRNCSKGNSWYTDHKSLVETLFKISLIYKLYSTSTNNKVYEV